MATSPRMRKALERVDARRVELERQIVAELEQRFFDGEPSPFDESTIHLGSAGGVRLVGATGTGCDSHFTTAWVD